MFKKKLIERLASQGGCLTLIDRQVFLFQAKYFHTILSSWYIWVFDKILVGYKFTCIAHNWWNHNLRQRSVHKPKTSKTRKQKEIKMRVVIKSGFLNIQRSQKYNVEMKTEILNEKGKCLLETFVGTSSSQMLSFFSCENSSKCQKYWTRFSSSLRWVLGKSSIISPCYINSSGIEQSV